MRLKSLSFRSICLVISFAWFLIIYPAFNFFYWERLPVDMRSGGTDFGQYYSAAMAVRFDAMQLLYAVPKKELYSQPPTFKPKIASPLFNPDPSTRQGKWAFYPQLGYPASSTVSPLFSEKAPRLIDDFHFVSPPPAALLLLPLAYFDYQTASKIWFSIMCASLFISSYYSSEICRYLLQRNDHIAGIVAIVPVIPTILASRMGTNLPAGNISPLIALLITLSIYCLLFKRDIVLGFSMILLIVFKGLALSWCPLILLGVRRWKTLITMTILSIVLNAATVSLGGIEVYKHFFQVVIPMANIPLGNGISGIAMTCMGIDVRHLSMLASTLGAILIYISFLAKTQSGEDQDMIMLAALAGLVSLFNLFNPIVWTTYLTYHLIIPFSSWIFCEINRLQLATKFKILILLTLAILALMFWLDTILFGDNSFINGWLLRSAIESPLVRKFTRCIYLFSIYGTQNLVPLLLLFLAYLRLKPKNQKVPLMLSASS